MATLSTKYDPGQTRPHAQKPRQGVKSRTRGWDDVSDERTATDREQHDVSLLSDKQWRVFSYNKYGQEYM